MFLGRYHHTLDEKGRLTIPAKFRDALVDGAFLTQGFDRNLRLITQADFEVMSARINRLSMTDPAIRQLRRFVRKEEPERTKDGLPPMPTFRCRYSKFDMVVGRMFQAVQSGHVRLRPPRTSGHVRIRTSCPRNRGFPLFQGVGLARRHPMGGA